MMPTRGACTCNAYSALSGLNGVLGRLPRASAKAACRGFHLALGFHPSPLWGLRAHGPLGTFPCTRTRSPNTSAQKMWVMTRANARGYRLSPSCPPEASGGGSGSRAARDLSAARLPPLRGPKLRRRPLQAGPPLHDEEASPKQIPCVHAKHIRNAGLYSVSLYGTKKKTPRPTADEEPQSL